MSRIDLEHAYNSMEIASRSAMRIGTHFFHYRVALRAKLGPLAQIPHFFIRHDVRIAHRIYENHTI